MSKYKTLSTVKTHDFSLKYFFRFIVLHAAEQQIKKKNIKKTATNGVACI